jgi:hypothetical protein
MLLSSIKNGRRKEKRNEKHRKRMKMDENHKLIGEAVHHPEKYVLPRINESFDQWLKRLREYTQNEGIDTNYPHQLDDMETNLEEPIT